MDEMIWKSFFGSCFGRRYFMNSLFFIMLCFFAYLSDQTYGIVQHEGQVEYMTFVLDVQEDGPAYMAGLRPGTA